MAANETHQTPDLGSNYYALKRSSLLSSTLLLGLTLHAALPQALNEWLLDGEAGAVRALVALTATYYLANFIVAWLQEVPNHLGQLAAQGSGLVLKLENATKELASHSQRAVTFLEKLGSIEHSPLGVAAQQDEKVYVVDNLQSSVSELVTDRLNGMKGNYLSLLSRKDAPHIPDDIKRPLATFLDSDLSERIQMVNHTLGVEEIVRRLEPELKVGHSPSVELYSLKKEMKSFGPKYLAQMALAGREVRNALGALRSATYVARTRVGVIDLAVPVVVYTTGLLHFIGRDFGFHLFPSIVTVLNFLLPGS